MTLTADEVWRALDDVKDPEIPMVSVVELGIVQSVVVTDDRVRVVITPTFTGCPALGMMRDGIAARVKALGAAEVEVAVSLHPAWTSDRIAPSAREKMRTIGLAPPPRLDGRFDTVLELQPVVKCPFCGSWDTVLENPFGPTLCRAMHYCQSCQQPFEEFKPL